MSEKQYIVVGDYLTDEAGQPVYVEPLELCRRYGVDPRRAILVDRRHHTYRHILRAHPDLPVLRPRQDNDYSLESQG